MRPRISREAIGPVDADGTANAKDRMTASCNDTVVRDTAEALVLDPLLLEIGRIITIQLFALVSRRDTFVETCS